MPAPTTSQLLSDQRSTERNVRRRCRVATGRRERPHHEPRVTSRTFEFRHRRICVRTRRESWGDYGVSPTRTCGALQLPRRVLLTELLELLAPEHAVGDRRHLFGVSPGALELQQLAGKRSPFRVFVGGHLQ